MRPPAEPISIEGLYERFGRPSFVPEGTALVMLDAKGVVIDAPFRHRRRLHVPAAVTAAGMAALIAGDGGSLPSPDALAGLKVKAVAAANISEHTLD